MASTTKQRLTTYSIIYTISLGRWGGALIFYSILFRKADITPQTRGDIQLHITAGPRAELIEGAGVYSRCSSSSFAFFFARRCAMREHGPSRQKRLAPCGNMGPMSRGRWDVGRHSPPAATRRTHTRTWYWIAYCDLRQVSMVRPAERAAMRRSTPQKDVDWYCQTPKCALARAMEAACAECPAQTGSLATSEQPTLDLKSLVWELKGICRGHNCPRWVEQLDQRATHELEVAMDGDLHAACKAVRALEEIDRAYMSRPLTRHAPLIKKS